MLPVTEPRGWMTAGQTLLYGIALVPISLFPSLIGVSGRWYFYTALILSGALLLVAARAAWLQSRATARSLFRASIGYLPLLLLALAIDRTPASALTLHLEPAAARIGVALPDAGKLPEFRLISAAGPFTRSSLEGSVWVADFIFTRCAGQCVLMSREMASLQAALRSAPGVKFVSFTVDPAYDTLERLQQYGARHGAEDGRWAFVTGEHAQITSLVRDGFRLGLSQDGTPQEPITHSLRLVLLDRRAHIRGYYDATDPRAVEQLAADAAALAGAAP
jgi:protein SCO1/2